MLVLSRAYGERIFIGDDIVITVLEQVGCKVRLGITAPSGVTIMREELAYRIDRERREAEERGEE